MTMTDDQRRQQLLTLGLDPDGDSLAHSTAPLPVERKAQAAPSTPQEADPHTMAVSEIVFTDAMIDGFPDLTGQGFKAASDHLFSLHKSPRRDAERHALLHRKITEFVGQVKRSRNTRGVVRERIKATAEQRELAEVLAAKGISAADLAALIQTMQQKETPA